MASFFSSAGSFLITVLASVFVFGIVIFIHELGHFLTAKFSGIQVNEFALGMGPTLFSFTRGGTKYGLRLFPIGGFVSMEGEDEESEEAIKRWFRQNLDASVTRIERQGRWRPAWFVDAESGGEPLQCYVRGDRTGGPPA